MCSFRPALTPYAQGNHAPWAKTWIQVLGKDGYKGSPGPHLDQNLLGQLRGASPSTSILGFSGSLFSRRPHSPGQLPSRIRGKLGTRKSRLETNTENEAFSALLARLWCHLILQYRANRAENPTRLCGAAIGQTGWRMVQVGAIRSRQKVVQLLAEIHRR